VPELPEVETTRRGLAPHLIGQTISGVVIRQPALRWPVPAGLSQLLPGQRIVSLRRRAKYLLLDCGNGTLILHLGMSGSLRILPAQTPAQKHDHFDLLLAGGQLMRLRDPRRFGAVLWSEDDPAHHPLLARLGPEPLEAGFGGCVLFDASRSRRSAVKLLIMDNQVVVGVGNIYANEALFRAGIAPSRPAGQLSPADCNRLADCIQTILAESIQQGGSTLRDFVDATGQPGYFQQSYWVYGRSGEPCRRCDTPVQSQRLGQRNTFFCPVCQP